MRVRQGRAAALYDCLGAILLGLGKYVCEAALLGGVAVQLERETLGEWRQEVQVPYKVFNLPELSSQEKVVSLVVLFRSFKDKKDR